MNVTCLPSPVKGKVQSDLDSHDAPSCSGSVFLSGNIEEFKSYNEGNENSDEEILDESHMDLEAEEDGIFDDNNDVTIEDLVSAEKILRQVFGSSRILTNIIKAIVSGLLDVGSDIAFQAVVYKVQSLVSGKHSVRYLRNYGLFWTGVRNLIKSRGLVVLFEHFPIPSKMSKYKTEILEMCGISKETLGKSGLQKANVDLWLDRKKCEVEGQKLGLSLSLDGKKIAVSAQGMEDLGGLGNRETVTQVDSRHSDEKNNMVELLLLNSRKSLFKLYDSLTSVSGEIISKIAALESLLIKTGKQVEKNPLLRKYEFVLNQQQESGRKILKSLDPIQSEVISKISKMRNSDDLLPNPDFSMDIDRQANFYRLEKFDENQEKIDLEVIEAIVSEAGNLSSISWSRISDEISRPLSKVPGASAVGRKLSKILKLMDKELFNGCGLSKIRPLVEMKIIYGKCNDILEESEQEGKIQRLDIIATFISQLAPMVFGNNLVVCEGGMFVEDGFCGSPDLIVKAPRNEQIVYSVIFAQVETETFCVDEELLSTCVVNSLLVKAEKGCLLVLHSKTNCLVFSVPKDDQLGQRMITFVKSYIQLPKCLKKRSQEVIKTINSLKVELNEKLPGIVTLGRYPIIENVIKSPADNVLHGVQQPNTIAQKEAEETKLLATEMASFLDSSNLFLSRQAKELICVNLSDMSGFKSNFPHTMLAASYLSSVSLKMVAQDCIKEVIDLVERHSDEVLNIGVDGESLHLITTTNDGKPGTELSLAKQVLSKLRQFSKEELCQLVSRNKNIDIKDNTEVLGDDMELIVDIDNEEDFEDLVDDSIIDAQVHMSSDFTLEEIETYFGDGNCSEDVKTQRYRECKAKKISDLRMLSLKYLLPLMKRNWIRNAYGSEIISIKTDSQILLYTPSTAFSRTSSGYFRTITFDAAHIWNLLRESVAKGKLAELGLRAESLHLLSEKPDFAFLKKILRLKNSKLEFDPMNQRSSSLCFSEKTEEGLREMKDFEGAKCCKLLRKGIIESFDESGVGSQERCLNVHNLKMFLNEKIQVCARLKRPGNKTITNELWQMLHASLDSHIATSLNMEFFHPRRKSTGSVEQLFGQMTMMCEGGMKLDCKMISDILERVTITNALRLVPDSVKGFSFLAELKSHMTSYTAVASSAPAKLVEYPKIFINKECSFVPCDSNFDEKSLKNKKRKMPSFNTISETSVSSISSDGAVRKFHKKF